MLDRFDNIFVDSVDTDIPTYMVASKTIAEAKV